MSNFDIELPNLNVDVSDSINKTLVVLRQSTTTLNRNSIPIQSVAEMAITASYAVTASHVLNAVVPVTLPPGLVTSSQQVINYGVFATTASNMLYGDQDIIGAFGDININIDEFEPHIEIITSNGQEDAEYHTYQLFQYNTSSGYFGFALDALRAGYSGWDGPVIAGDDGVFNYPSFIGFQDARNYTDGRVTVLTPLVVSGSIIFPDGTTQSTAGGGGSTGDITFNGVQIIGAGTASGDGNGYSTLELVPDVSLYANDQYIIVDPTQPSHIHLRAGGIQDDSNAELYLGGELNYVRVVDGGGVRLNNGQFTANFYQFQQDTDYDTATWSTDESGNHWIDIDITNPSSPTRPSEPFNVPFYSFTQYPQNRIEVFDGTNYIDVSSNGQAYTLGNPYQLRIGTTEAPPSNPSSLLSLTFRINTLSENALQLENNDLDLYVTNNAYIYADQTIQITTGQGNIQITTDDNNSSQSWYLTAQGYTQFPSGVAPTTSKGQEGDEAGSVTFDNGYIYYCTDDYTDGIADIWKRVAWSNDTWG